MGDKDVKYKIDIAEDAVFLCIETPPGAKNTDPQEVLKYVKSMGVKDIDFSAIASALKNNSPSQKVKISENTEVEPKDEMCYVSISRDKMEAAISFSRPNIRGKLLTPEAVSKSVEDAGVKFGLNRRLLKALLSKRDYDVKYVIASGAKPINGKDGTIEYNFDTKPKNSQPKILEDGRVDFKELSNFDIAYAGQILASTTPPTEGTNGTNVLGDQIDAKRGKIPPRLPKGKNTRISDSGSDLISEVTGRIVYVDNKVSISPVLEIKNDVGLETGNIDFAGNVIIKGNVKSGFSVKSTGSVEVFGTLEGAKIEAAGDVKVYGGIQGMEVAEVISGGAVFVRYSESATVKAEGDITADSILHSKISCNGSLRLEGRKCIIVGGKVSVVKSISCKVIGSIMSSVTEIITGHRPEHVEKFEALKKELKTAKAEYDKNEVSANSLLKTFDLSSMPQDKKDFLVKIVREKTRLRERIKELQDKISTLSLEMSSVSGEIYVSKKIYSGAKITIGNAVIHVKEDIDACMLKNVENKILICSYK